MKWKSLIVLYRGVVGRVPAFQPGGPGSIPVGVKKYNFYSEIACVTFAFFCPVLFLAVPPPPDIVLTTHSGRRALMYLIVFWFTMCCSPYRRLTYGHLDCKSRGCKSYINHQGVLPKGKSFTASAGTYSRLQFRRRQVFHRKLRKQGYSFTSDWLGAVAFVAFCTPTHSL